MLEKEAARAGWGPPGRFFAPIPGEDRRGRGEVRIIWIARNTRAQGLPANWIGLRLQQAHRLVHDLAIASFEGQTSFVSYILKREYDIYSKIGIAKLEILVVPFQ